MPLREIPAQDIDEEALRNLVAGQVPEGRTIDYKQQLPGAPDSARRDFLADLCSFANAAGGHIVYGMTEGDGLPVDLVGVEGDIDQAVLRLENMARDGIRPPIPALQFVRVALAAGSSAIVASIPRSWNAPHQVIFQRDFRFYTRGSAGRQHLDVDELRQIILLSQETGERIRQFRAARVASIMSDETPIPLLPGAREILHIVPLNAFGSGAAVDLAALVEQAGLAISVMHRGGSQRFNIDGLLAYSPTREGHDSYAQFFRNGIIEVVVFIPEWNRGGRSLLPSLAFERDVVRQVSRALAALQIVSAVPPVAVMLSFTGIRGWDMGANDRWGTQGGFDRDPIIIPDLLLETLNNDNVPAAVRPIIDATWNAAGFPQSENYDDEGAWMGERGR